MCGIAGELHFGLGNPSLSRIELINRSQDKRGPDGVGLYHLDNMALGHRRLKIFDLTDRASQPMVDHTLGLALVFNGAIYNFLELRKELELKGYNFVSGSDTEVLLKAWHAWGESCLEKLRGMFAFAIWERDTGKLMLARDRLGIKPLYYADLKQGICFASTLPALLHFDDIDTSISADGLNYYLSFHAVPEPLTIISGIRKLAPGSVMTIHSDGRKEERRYWQFSLDDKIVNHERDDAAWLSETQKALMFAVKRQLSADVPVGILLSGGLDSSLLVALAAQEITKGIETFSLGFESAGGEEGNEFYYSDMVASQFETRHHKMFISNHQLVDSLPECVSAMSEPMPSHDNIGFYLLSKEVSKHVRVILSGQGADEIFAGYHWFQKVGYQHANADTAPHLLNEMLVDYSAEDYAQLVTSEFRTGDHSLPFLKQFCAENESQYLINPLLAYESTFALAGGPLRRVDNMTMAFSLEARVPFLDEEVVDLAATMPLECKLQDDGKSILKKLARKMLPQEVVDRPKGYFPVPALKYMQGPTLELMHEVLSPARVRDRGIFNPQAVETLLREPHLHLTPNGASKLWQVGLLEFWLQQQRL